MKVDNKIVKSGPPVAQENVIWIDFKDKAIDKLFIKSNFNELNEIFEYVVSMDNKEIAMIVKYASINLEKHSLKTLPKRLSEVFFSR